MFQLTASISIAVYHQLVQKILNNVQLESLVSHDTPKDKLTLKRRAMLTIIRNINPRSGLVIVCSRFGTKIDFEVLNFESG